jgi:endogenous inhibitor of DNA gyrase (YacG/DUF329 family)
MEPERCKADCPSCGEALWRQRQGEWTLANRIVRLTPDGDLAAKCPRCAEDVLLNFIVMAEPKRPRRRLVVRTALDTGPAP